MPRTAGTRTMIDSLLGRLGRTRTPEDDLAELERGGHLRVVVYTRDVARDPSTVKKVKWRGGMSSLQQDRLAGLILTVVGPMPRTVTEIADVEGKFSDSEDFREIRGTSPKGEWVIAVHEVDVPVVRRALEGAPSATPEATSEAADPS